MDDSVGTAVGKWPKGKTLLVVVDDEATRRTFTLLLEGKGYAVVPAENGQEALDYLRGHPPPDLVLLTLRMPVMDGYEFRREQRNDPVLTSIPVIVLSAGGEAVAHADLLGRVGCVQQPVDTDVLLAAIQRFTASSRSEILVVEDEAAILTMLDVALRHYGFGVRLAASGQEAVELYGQHHESIAVALLDVQMPGLDGPSTLAALKRINPEVRCCFMSGHTGKYAAEELLAMGAAHVFLKPFVSLSIVTGLLWDMIRVDG
jgi:CheY-like chemotaxis protein